MGDTIITLALCLVVGTVAYVAGKNDGAAAACDARDSAGRHVLQRVVPVGDVSADLRILIDGHNSIILKMCNR